MKTFQNRTKIITGSAEDFLKEKHIGRLLVVCDPFFAKNGTAQRFSLAEQTQVFDKVMPDPTVELAAQGAALVQRFQPEAVLALGGGSTMDCAKAMVYFSGSSPELIAVPTTSGSGSEVTDFAILTHDGVKHPLVDEKLRPQTAILDECLLQALPGGLIAEGGFDLVSHGLEAIAATGATAISDALAAHAIRTALELLPRSFAGVQAVRGAVHEAATMAGLSFSAAGLGLCHAMAHALGGAFHIPHGRLNAILLPLVLEYNAPGAGSRYAALAAWLGLGASNETIALRSLKNALLQLRRQLRLPQSLSRAGVTRQALREKMEAIVAATLADPCCATNPVPVTQEAVRRLLLEALGHG